jgi:hypothetical protein
MRVETITIRAHPPLLFLPYSSLSPLSSAISSLFNLLSPISSLLTSISSLYRIEEKVADATEKENDSNWNLLEPTSVTSLNDAAYGMFFCSSSREPSVRTFFVLLIFVHFSTFSLFLHDVAYLFISVYYSLQSIILFLVL